MDRTEYLAEVATWINNYNELSEKIRKARTAYKQAQREGESVYKTLGEYERLKHEATAELSNREELKEEARLAWEARRQPA